VRQRAHPNGDGLIFAIETALANEERLRQIANAGRVYVHA
jgi:hypothetical protein